MKPVPAGGQRIEVSPHPVADTIETHGCSVVLRRLEGPEARELYFHCQPPAEITDARGQAEAIYRAILSVLAANGGSLGSVVTETVFLRHLRANVASVREARHRVLASHGGTTHRPATSEIEQPPLNECAFLEVSIQAVLPSQSPVRFEPIEARPVCACAECARAHGLRIHIGDETRFHAAALCGPGKSAYEQTLGMFCLAEELLQQAGMEFRDVVRTWIHLREIDRDYAELNRARREFFRARGIDPAPASTGIGGGPVPEGHDLCLGIYAVKAGRPLVRTVMTSPTLNEAPQYGADFVRGTKVVETNKVALHVSGTASIDEYGRTAHVDDFDAQADRMFVNIAALLERQHATFGDVVSAITYLKHPADARRLREKISAAGFEGFPHVLVAAPICRPDLLCETEALAVLPPMLR
ncbi:MAG: endoribonuclease l-psp [Acidobacteria bacterium]|nr:endoribonuclease l-psp [Acidobacteriota bacterium]